MALPLGACRHAQPVDWSPEATAAYLADVGTWQFDALPNGPDNWRECRETWHFDEDGNGWVRSGEQFVTLTWRSMVAKGRNPARVLYVTDLSSTGGPDCLGRAIDPDSHPREDWGFILEFTKEGTVLICGEASFQYSFDRTKSAPLIGGRENCWASLQPANKG